MRTYGINLRLALSIMEELGTARALSVAILLRSGDVAGVMSLPTPNPVDYDNIERYFCDRQASDLFRKLQVNLPSIDRRSPTISKWWQGERQCYRSNERLAKFENRSNLSDPSELAVFDFLSKVRKTITSWVGSKPPSLDSIQGRFGPGSTYSDREPLTTVADKMVSNPTLTPGSAWYLLNWVGTKWGENIARTGRDLVFVRGNRFATVPKTGLIDRAIAVEPAINVFYQLGLGRAIRERLRRATGWDLDHAQHIHRLVACEASVSREFATLDLSNASDTVSLELVRLLLPPAWFAELSALRSPYTFVPRESDGKKGWCKLEKFSSMGNGFTFELETLIFSALLEVYLSEVDIVGPSPVPLHKWGSGGSDCFLGSRSFVFGDDIILPDQHSEGFKSILRFCGFSLNQEKSFSGASSFRESCGADFMSGVDVRAFSIKVLYENDPWKTLPHVNGIRKLLERLATIRGRLNLRPWHLWVDSLPIPLRGVRGPEDLGDCVLHDSPDRWKVKVVDGIRWIRIVRWSAEEIPWVHWTPDIHLACVLFRVGLGARGITPRGSKQKPKLDWAAYS